MLPRGLEGDHGMGLQQGELRRASRTAHVGLQRGEGFALRLEDTPAQGGIRYPGIYAGGDAVAIGVDHPIDPAPCRVVDVVRFLGLGPA